MNSSKHDIAERRVTTRDSALIQSIFLGAVDGIVVISDQGIVEMINPAAERLFGYTAEAVLGRNVSMLMPEPYRAEHDGYLANYLRTGTRKIIGIGREVEGRRKDGRTFPLYLSVSEVRDGDRRLFTGIVHDLTARKQAEKRIARLQHHQERILAAAAEGILGLDAQSRISFANVSAGTLLGRDPQRLIGRSVREIWPEVGAGNVPHNGALADGSVCRAECAFFLDGQGRLFPVEYSSAPIRESERNVGTVISFQDISERKRSQESLRRERDTAQTYLNLVQVTLVGLDHEGQITLVNRKGCDTLGYEEEQLIGRDWFDLCVPQRDRARTRVAFEQLMAGQVGPVKYFENGVLTRGGDERLIAWHNTLLRDSEGHVRGTLSSGQDITEQKRAARELQRMRAYLKNIIDSMPSILVGVDLDNRVTEWNKRAEQATGVPQGAAVGRPIHEVFPRLGSQLETVREAIRKREPVQNVRMVSEEQGETQYADMVVYPLLANGVDGAVIRVDDVTNRVRIEQMMVQTEKMMSVGGLAAGMAHEINNPLSAILQGSQNIQRRLSAELPANQAASEVLGLDLDQVHCYLEDRGILRFLDSIREAGARAARIVEDMLAFSRRSNTDLAPVAVDEMLDTVIRLAGSDYDLKKRYDFKRIEIVRDYDPALGPVRCVCTEIEQVFLNLIKNAAQAMTDQSCRDKSRITLRTRREGDMARIEVEDSGPGMDEATRSRVFEPFYTTKPVGLGTGLGLSVSYFIVAEQHRGQIRARSMPGHGSCFIVQLPINGS